MLVLQMSGTMPMQLDYWIKLDEAGTLFAKFVCDPTTLYNEQRPTKT